MRFRDDTRGVTVQVGAVLLFATVIIALAVFQATVVPAENADVEYRHSQQVEGQMIDVRNALVATAETGNARPATVSLGTQYPNRLFLVNPPPPAGTLETTTEPYENPNITLSNVVATNDETAEYLNFTASNPWTAETKALSYVPGYHEYRNAPRLRYEASLLSSYYPEEDASVPVAEQLLVDDDTRTISLVALSGSVSTSRSSSVAVDPVSLSSSQRVQVEPENKSERVNITIPTVLDADTLEESMSDTEGVEVQPVGGNRTRLLVDWNDTFTLRTAKVGVGSDTSRTSARYLTAVEPRPDDGLVTLDSTSDSVTVEVRDRFNNPKPGKSVEVAPGDTGAFDTNESVTDENGQATFEVNDSPLSTIATLQILGGGTAERRVNVSIDTTTTGGDGGGGDGDGGVGNGSEAYVVDWIKEEIGNQPGMTCTAENCTLDASDQQSVTLTANSTPQVDGGTFTYELQNQSVGNLNPVTGTTNASGVGETTFSATANGTTYAYVSGGGSGDRIYLNVTNYGSGASAGPQISTRVDDLTRQNENQPVYIASYDVSSTNSSFERVDVTFRNLDSGGASGTQSSSATKAGLRYSNSYGSGANYEIVYEVIYTDSGGNEYVAATETVDDVADAQNPSGNAELDGSDDASFTDWEIRDRTQVSNNQPRYRYSYETTGTGSFSEVRAFALNVPGSGESGVRTFNNRNANNQDIQFGYGANQEYRVGILVRDANGTVVDSVSREDIADGDDQYSGP